MTSLRICIIYGLIHFCTSLMHNIFVVYHVYVFVSCFGLSKLSFWTSEFLFLLWNAINDPIFGWLLDKKILRQQMSNQVIAHERARFISICGPFLGLAFLSTWFPHWLPNFPGLRFVIVLCTYDTALTLVELMKSSLLADLAVSQVDRSRLGSAASVGNALSVNGLVVVSWCVGGGAELSLIDQPFDVAETLSEKHSISNGFQACAVLITIFSAVGLFCGGLWLANMTDLTIGALSSSVDVHRKVTHSIPQCTDHGFRFNNKAESQNIFVFLFDIISRPNFLAFCLMQAFQVFHCHFNSNFFPLFSKLLLGPGHEKLISAILGISFVLPHVNNVLLLKACDACGTYAVIRGLFFVKVALGIVLLLSGPSNLPLLSVFLACIGSETQLAARCGLSAILIAAQPERFCEVLLHQT
uniref:Zgc:171489 n=1 Tax=Mesocestoides corti TaxID=53468 RepID=A0A5K3EH74_MESCO